MLLTALLREQLKWLSNNQVRRINHTKKKMGEPPSEVVAAACGIGYVILDAVGNGPPVVRARPTLLTLKGRLEVGSTGGSDGGAIRIAST